MYYFLQQENESESSGFIGNFVVSRIATTVDLLAKLLHEYVYIFTEKNPVSK